VTLVYDLAQRKAVEEVCVFDVKHGHGTFRGNCRGLLMMDFLDIAFRLSAGSHGFRIPFKLMKLSIKGRVIGIDYISDNRNFQNFKLRDKQAAEKFKRSWDGLTAWIRLLRFCCEAQCAKFLHLPDDTRVYGFGVETRNRCVFTQTCSRFRIKSS
jgi:hypothetical protein